jgi:hypothetical protein
MRILAAVAMALSACDEAEATGAGTPAITLQTISLAGTTSAAATVTIDQQRDTDGTEDTAWSAHFTLDGKKTARTLPADDGSVRTYVFDVKSVPTGAGVVSRTRISVRVGEGQ